jgi:hypothetical protein
VEAWAAWTEIKVRLARIKAILEIGDLPITLAII